MKQNAMKGRIVDLSAPPYGKQRLTVELDSGDFRGRYDSLTGKDVKISIELWRGKRSLDQNALYWMNLTRLARAVGTTNQEMHNIMLRRYGQVESFGDQIVYVFIPDTPEAEHQADMAETYHVKPTSNTKDGKDGIRYRAYILLRGSSTYNSAEMADLINGLESECKEAGVEFLSSEADKMRGLCDDEKN